MHAMDHSLEIFKELLYLCAYDINLSQLTDGENLSLLMIAIKKNKLDIAQFLLEQGASIDSECILSAIDNNSYKMVKMLFEYDAEFSIDDEKGQQIFDNAIIKGNRKIIDLLIWLDITI